VLWKPIPTFFKSAYIMPLLKEPDFDPAHAKSYLPISNLSVLSKLLERLVAREIIEYLTENRLLPKLQSAYHANHSTGMAMLKVLADILRAVNNGDLAVLTLLDLSADFEPVDHSTLLRRLRTSYGFGDSVFAWFASYLDGHTQHVCCGSSNSHPAVVKFGVPLGSVLGPILFLLYTVDLLRLIELHNLHPHLYTDDAQIYGFCRPGATAQLQDHMTACVDDVALWMQSNRLQLITTKTEVLWCSSARRLHQIPTVPLIIRSNDVIPVSTIRDLGIYMTQTFQ